MKSIFPILLLLVQFGCNQAEKKPSTNGIVYSSAIDKSAIDKSVDTILVDSLINSLSIGIYYKGEKFMYHYGEMDRGKNNKPTNKTIYEIASVTKTFVGALIAQAEMEGKLSIEDDIRNYIGYDFTNLEYDKNPIRIKHLLTHTSELPRFLPESINELFEVVDDELPFRIADIENSYSKSEFLKDLKNVSIDTIPGTRFSYSNADTEIAAYILEKVYHDSFDNILEEKICRVAKMPNTGINLNGDQIKYLANGYGSDNKLTPFMSTKLWGASGAGKSTISDLVNYIIFQLNNDNEVVKRTHQTLYDKEIIFDDPNNKIGYFWIINEDPDLGKYLSHHGGAFGTQNWIFLYPEIDLGITIITNQGDWQTGGKLMYIIDGIIREIKKAHNNG